MTSWGVLERLEGLVTHFLELIYFVSDSGKKCHILKTVTKYVFVYEARTVVSYF